VIYRPKGGPATGSGGSGRWIGNIWGVLVRASAWEVRKGFSFFLGIACLCRVLLSDISWVRVSRFPCESFVHHRQRHCDVLFLAVCDIPGVYAVEDRKESVYMNCASWRLSSIHRRACKFVRECLLAISLLSTLSIPSLRGPPRFTQPMSYHDQKTVSWVTCS